MSTTQAMAGMPGFAAFYRAINGWDPFPWQDRLAQVVAREGWPAEVGVPTGLGKTACLDIAIWWLASQADRAPEDRTAPTRIWWIVNRRLLVDSTADHADELLRKLRSPGRAGLRGEALDAVAAVARRLCSLSAGQTRDPLEVIRLRGGVVSRRPTDPSKPAVILATVPMYGSRLLFRGYGSSRSMLPVDAALAGTDSLVLVDEAHLATHLQRLIPALEACTPGARAVLGESRSRPRVVALTATGDAGEAARFDLGPDDLAHDVVTKRLDAAKPVEVRVPQNGDVAKLLAEAALDLLPEAPAKARCLVFANTPRQARAAFELLRSKTAGDSVDVRLLTGRSRDREVEKIRKQVLDPVHGMSAKRDASRARERHLIVVATQTLEVGADVDAEYLVTEACGVRALTQRLGRLNRLGRYPHARGVYIHLPPPKAPKRRRGASGSVQGWPVYGEEPVLVLERLEAALDGGTPPTVELSPRRVSKVLGQPGDDPGRAPEVLPALLGEWTKTTTPPEGEAPVEPYFSGIARPDYSVSLLWRAHVPGDGESLWPRASDSEAVQVPVGEVREALDDDEELCRLGPDRVTLEEVSPSDLRPGDTCVLPCDWGLLDEFGWNPSSTAPVADVSLLDRGLPLDPSALQRLCGVELASLVKVALGVSDDDEGVDDDERVEAIEEILDRLLESSPPGWDEEEWRGFLASLDRRVVSNRREVSRLPSSGATAERPSDEDDERSLAESAVDLGLHGRAVADRIRAIGERIGVVPELAPVVERAGSWHDVGKADRRFQRWLVPDREEGDVLVAKSTTPRHLWGADRAAAGWPRGGRHEELSARLARDWLRRQNAVCDSRAVDLLLHLIVSHHGRGRPLLLPVEDGTAGTVSALIDGIQVETGADLAIVDWDQPARFSRLNDRFGPWGLALLEAVVRQADHAVSSGDVGGRTELDE
ncbi:MAG: type I-U CRISPR-associated helicase/endonuclease Cas3 [Holophagales bacterium]|nr:type I-U CRISPR-associated helicase/endonuclease Cas3 [Holophagales bacterium]MYG31620.1 type I-U CRISPR-associated helicase/endonuclease Cas3 [Holophagales bacterium]MYI78311.1 type I-U CRISPR-associated helicase/endonuclease Cas3 [Holophagales bacterium]